MMPPMSAAPAHAWETDEPLPAQDRYVTVRGLRLYVREQGDGHPLLLINGTGDRLWAQAQAFAQRLAEVGARHEVIALDDAPHGLENWEGREDWTSYKRRLVAWIRQVVSAR